MFNGNKGKRLFMNMKAPFMWAPFTPPESYVFYEIKVKIYKGKLESICMREILKFMIMV